TLLGAVCLLALAGAYADEAYQQTAEGVVLEPATGPAKRVRLQVMSDRIVRVTAVPTESLDLPSSLVVTARPGSDATFTVQRLGRKLKLSTRSLAAEVSLDTGVVSFLDPQGHVRLAERDR